MKTPVNMFVSYARANQALKKRLMADLLLRLNLARNIDFTAWQDHMIEPGTDWSAALDSALAACDTGLCLLSPAFFASGVVTGQELPQLLPKALGVFPVLLQPLNFGQMDLGALDGVQAFSLNGQSYLAMATPAAKVKFADALAERITTVMQARLGRLAATTTAVAA